MAWKYVIGVKKGFTREQQIQNAVEFYNFFSRYGATLESICGMLGNITQESGINPGNKQSASYKSGWGLIQWTPSTVLTEWCSDNGFVWYDGAAQCERITAEGENRIGASGTWLPTQEYPYSWAEFISLTDVYIATYAYLKERERAGNEAISERLAFAVDWYEYFSGHAPNKPPNKPPIEPADPAPAMRSVNRMPVWLMTKKL